MMDNTVVATSSSSNSCSPLHPSKRQRTSSPISTSISTSAKGKGREIVESAAVIDVAASMGSLDKRSQDQEAVDQDEHCAICLSPIIDRTSISPCQHAIFCFGCIKPWCDQSRRCPLCLGLIERLIHNIRSERDYQTHYLFPLVEDKADFASTSIARSRPLTVQQSRHALYGRTRNVEDESTKREREEERAIERRRYIYRESLFAKHIAANRYTGFKVITPHSFSNPALKAKVLIFVRRELQVFPNIDIPFLTTYLLSICAQIDLRSSSAIRLLSDFLSEAHAEHFAHEVMTFARSPATTLEGYDRMVQYGRPERIVEERSAGVVDRAGNGIGQEVASLDRRARRSSDRRGRLSRDADGYREMAREGHRRREHGREGHTGAVDGYARQQHSRKYDDADGRKSDGREANRRSRSRSTSRSKSTPRSLSPSRTRKRSRSDSRSRRINLGSSRTSEHLSAGAQSESGDGRVVERDGKEVTPPTVKTKPAVASISIFGAAMRNITRATGSDDTILPSPSTATTDLSLSSTPVSPTSSIIPSSTASTSSIRLKLQSRLLDEYRAKTANNVVKADLRRKLQDRLRLEKALASHDVEDDDVDQIESPYTYTMDIRNLLQQRLEEEHRLAGVDAGSYSDDDLENEGAIGKEEVSRLELDQESGDIGRTVTLSLVDRGSGGTMAERLKEKLLREKLVGKLQQQQPSRIGLAVEDASQV